MPKPLLKKIGVALLFIPLSLLLFFTFGEVFSGDLSGLSHLIQAATIIFLIFLALKKPLIGGLLLSSIGLILGTLYALNAPFGFQTIFLVEIFLFVPPFISGILLIISSIKF
ncbi:MAG: hypothetical protein PVJ09_02070 [Candidatus Woesebacteria bacterium]|jgi:hypothetical protein